MGIAFGRFVTADHLGYVGQVFRHAPHGLDLLHKLIRFGSLFDSGSPRGAAHIDVTPDTISVLASTLDTPSRLECVEATLFGVVTQLQAFVDTLGMLGESWGSTWGC